MGNDKLLIALIAGVVGATLQYIFTHLIERSKHKANLRMQANIDFIKGITGAAIALKANDKQKQNEFGLLTLDSKTRIAIYGDKKTVEFLADFCSYGGNLVTKEDIDRFIKVIQCMRLDSDKSIANPDDIYKLLYNRTPKTD